MTDREMLDLAAKAMGLTVLRSRLDDQMWRDLLIDMRPEFPQTKGWNPLTDDGDALRLAVKLRKDHRVQAAHLLPPFDSWIGGDHHAASRRAIVRAAAEIGRTMK